MKIPSPTLMNRWLCTALITVNCLLLTDAAFAQRYHERYRNVYYTCPSGYQMVLIPQHWFNGYLVPAQYVCKPIYYHNRYEYYYRDGRYHGRHGYHGYHGYGEHRR